MFRSYIFKLTRSPFLYLGFLAVLGLCLYGTYNDGSRYGDVYSELSGIICWGFYRKIFTLFAALPFAANFSVEWNSKSVINCITRKNTENYAFTNAVMCYLSAFSVIFFGFMLWILLRAPFKPLIPDYEPNPLIYTGPPLFAVTVVVFVYASSCAAWAVMGLAATAFFPSKYVAVCAPFVLSYIFERLAIFLPGELGLFQLSVSWSDWKPLPAFLKSELVFFAIAAVCSVIFIIKVKRRVENELS